MKSRVEELGGDWKGPKKSSGENTKARHQSYETVLVARRRTFKDCTSTRPVQKGCWQGGFKTEGVCKMLGPMPAGHGPRYAKKVQIIRGGGNTENRGRVVSAAMLNGIVRETGKGKHQNWGVV